MGALTEGTATDTASLSCKIRDKWTKSRQVRERARVYVHLDTHTHRVVRASPLPAAIKLLAVG